MFDEAFRSIRTNLRMAIAGDGCRSILVTSACAGDGKTLVAKNLALSLALSDERVVLIDADLRRAGPHVLFDLPEQPGLTDLLLGRAVRTDVVRSAAVPGLHVLTRGTKSRNPSELLDSPRFKEILAELGTDFDWIVLDAPPVMPVTDSIVLCRKVTGLLVIAAAESTPLPALQTMLERLRPTRVPVVGAVLNRADLRRRGYYYAEYYQRDFESYHAQPAAQV
jgi:capsular exopolysaccharide synthesis family protein